MMSIHITMDANVGVAGNYPACACTARVKLSQCVCVCVGKEILKSASSRAARAFEDVILNE